MLRLASGSPRRIELLRRLDVPFEVAPADIDERRVASPATAKADAIARSGEPTLAADTEVLLDEERVGKPKSDGDALTMLADLAGREHDVRTEVVVVGASGRRITFAVRSRVTMRRLSLREIERYVESGEPLDKAGGYAIQGEGRRLVAGYEGCFANVTGLPLCHVYHALRRVGVVSKERPERVCQEHFDFTCPVWRAVRRQGESVRDRAEYESWRDRV
ncbi:MAG TPA: Maf family protein [Candidatus Limnocylindria bacterium]|nr:Maf family protein [Candidatus Limnocylindria bacterium]